MFDKDAATSVVFYIGLGDQLDDDRRRVAFVEDAGIGKTRTRIHGLSEVFFVHVAALTGRGEALYCPCRCPHGEECAATASEVPTSVVEKGKPLLAMVK
jgi:hypothetical protein